MVCHIYPMYGTFTMYAKRDGPMSTMTVNKHFGLAFSFRWKVWIGNELQERVTVPKNLFSERFSVSCRRRTFFLKNGPSPASFIVYLWSFQTNITIFTTIYEKMSIQSPDSNPRPLGRECPPITTRPGLPGVLSYHDCHGRTDFLFHCILDWIGSNVAASES